MSAARNLSRELALETSGPDFAADAAGRGLGSAEELSALASVVARNAADDFLCKVAFSLPLRSPLEVIFYAAIESYCVSHGITLIDDNDVGREIHDMEQPINVFQALAVCCQHRLGPYQIDFRLVAFVERSRVGTSVAVEVDGHDFHERTKAQAAHDRKKDRAIQASGLKILRFTGSEVYATPLKCALEAIDAAFGGQR